MTGRWFMLAYLPRFREARDRALDRWWAEFVRQLAPSVGPAYNDEFA